jgi:hypothetical protein
MPYIRDQRFATLHIIIFALIECLQPPLDASHKKIGKLAETEVPQASGSSSGKLKKLDPYDAGKFHLLAFRKHLN